MNNLKKTSIIACSLLVCCSFFAVGCGHKHTFSDEWKSNDVKHWHPATCEHTDVKGDEGMHSYFLVETDTTFVEQCVCGKTKTGYNVKFVYESDGSPAGSGIAVAWNDAVTGSNVAYGETDALGKISKPGLKADKYALAIDESTLPTINGVKYTFDKQAITEQKNGIGLIIALFPDNKPNNIGQVVNGDEISGRLQNTADRFEIDLDKSYVTEFLSKDDKVWFTVNNDGAGTYTAKVITGLDIEAKMDRYVASIAYVAQKPDSTTDKSVKNQLSYKVSAVDSTLDSTFVVQIDDAPTYPVSVRISVTVSDKVDFVAATKYDVKPTHFETKSDLYTYTVTERGETVNVTMASLAPVNLDKKADNIPGAEINDLTRMQLQGMTKHEDGYYYTADDQLVYAKLDAPSIFDANTLVNQIDANMVTNYRVMEYDPEYGYLTKYDDYFGFVRAYYALCNDDGIYPLTEEMKDYLTIVADKNRSSLEMLLCTYPVQINDFASGNGSESSPFVMNAGSTTYGNYEIDIPTNGSVFVTVNANDEIAFNMPEGVNAKIGGVAQSAPDFHYDVDGSVTVEFTSTIAGKAVISIEEYVDPTILHTGNNTITVPASGTMTYTFTVSADGEYEFTIPSTANGKLTITANGTSYVLGEAESGSSQIVYSYPIALSSGDVVTVVAATLTNEQEQCNLSININE